MTAVEKPEPAVVLNPTRPLPQKVERLRKEKDAKEKAKKELEADFDKALQYDIL